jgi:3-dehydroquinate synthase
MREVIVSLGERSYPIRIGGGALDGLPQVLSALGVRGPVGLVSDGNVDPLYGDRVRALVREADGATPVTHVMPPGEEHKRLARIEEVCGVFLEGGLDRSSVVVALGGGVVGDVAAFAAACFMRGVPFVQIPTTIVAQVDSSVGGKTGVNHPLGKNTIGAFHQPAAVLVEPPLLQTLPDRELRAGLAEVVKHGVIADEALFAYLENEAGRLLAKDLDALMYPVQRSCEIKAEVVAQDEREHGLRAILNYGHTFGHGIEAVTAYRQFLHGEAVALGMCAAAALSRELGLVDETFDQRQRACIEACGLPVAWDGLPVEETLRAMRRDKKVRAGAMKFILADRIGHVVQRTDITEDQARRALDAVRSG